MNKQYNAVFIKDLKYKYKPANKESNNELLSRVAEGDESAREEMIGRNIPLVISTVGCILRRHPSCTFLRDDATSAGTIGLCRAVQHIVNGKAVENVSAFLTYWIRYEVKKLLSKEKVLSATEDTEVAAVSIEVACEPDDMALVDLRDLVFSCCETEVETSVIKMRLNGVDRRDIAKRIGVSPPCITRMLRRLEHRYYLARQLTL